MSSSQCVGAPVFSISGEQSFSDTNINFQAIFEVPEDADEVEAYQWFIDDTLITNITESFVTGNVACGSHKVGLRLLSDSGWSGIKELAFVTCKVVETDEITGPYNVYAGKSQAFQVIGNFSDGTSIDLTPSYVFTAASGGSFTGNVFTADADDTGDDYKLVTITATKGISVVTKNIRINNPDYANAGTLVVDLFNYQNLEVLGYISDADVVHSYQPAYTGNNYIWNESPPRAPLILASDYINQAVLNWRFEFNIARLKHNHPNKQHFTFYLAGKADQAFLIRGSINVVNMRGTMAMDGLPNSYIPYVSGGQDLYDITNFTSHVEAGATGSYAIADLQTILKIEFDVLSNTFVKTTNSGTGNLT